MQDIKETSRQLEITTGQLASARCQLEEIKFAMQDSARTHIMMLRGEIAWDAAKLRHLLGDDDLLDMLIRCEGWFSTLPEGRKMQLECQRVISLKSPTP
jgi:hypothetical protein